ncbi:unnamed protein product [Strongylus vulgaris]|uniref:G-protein coupled receptors family 1 profile domain-containing protein n=1 Tax=Strongylus vulgaris TaxID=40348 RepID=A0A3P7IDQ1_STRVU|nr:unnamed protein product [Strongylus vulgaris]
MSLHCTSVVLLLMASMDSLLRYRAYPAVPIRALWIKLFCEGHVLTIMIEELSSIRILVK